MISNDLTYDWTPSPTGREFPIRGLSALELSAIDAVLFHHPFLNS